MPVCDRFLKSHDTAGNPIDGTGEYIREIFMPAGTLLTSKIHKTVHPYKVITGKVYVWTPDEGLVLLTAPCCGITKPMTRRVLFTLEDTIWRTYHSTDETDVSAIERQIIVPHEPGQGHVLSPAESEAIDRFFLRLVQEYQERKMLAGPGNLEQEQGKPMSSNLSVNGGAS